MLTANWRGLHNTRYIRLRPKNIPGTNQLLPRNLNITPKMVRFMAQVKPKMCATLIGSGLRGGANVSDGEWIKTLEDGRKVKFIYQVLPEDGAFITAQIAGNEVVYSVVLAKARNPLSRDDVESHFKGELSKK